MAVANVPSSLLSAEENDLLFTLVGARKQTRTTTPVEVLERPSGAIEWTTCGNGVACFVKDNVKKSYFIRVFNLDSKACIFELDALTIDAGTLKSSDLVFEEGDPCTLTFPAKYTFTPDKKMMFRFRDASEAKNFVEITRDKLEDKAATKTRRQTPQSRQPPPPPPGRYSSNPPSPPSSAQSSSRSSSTSSESSNLSLFGRVKRKPKPKINKADIGRPADLRHTGHVGYDPSTRTYDSGTYPLFRHDPSTGAFDSSSVAPEWRKLLDTIGVSDEQLKDKDTASFIYDFVERHGGIAEANRQLQKKPPPPPPSRSRVVDPPPPPNRGRSGDSSPPPPLPARGRTPSGSSPPPPPPPTRRDSSPPPPTRRDSSPPPPPPTRRDSSPPPPPVPARVRTPSGSSPPSRASQHLQGSSPPPSPPRRISSARGLK